MPTIRDTPLVGSAEAAKLLEIGPTNFSHLRKKMQDAGDESFPQPITKLQCGPIWLQADMIKFKKHYDSRRRRVRSSNGDTAAAATPVKATTKPIRKTAAKTAAKAPRNTPNSKSATVTTIGSKPKRTLKVKTSV